MACLYMITAPSGRSYIGYSSRDASSRFSEHVSNSNSSRSSSILHSSIKKYGAEKMTVRTLVIGSDEYCFDMEDSAIKAFGTMMPNGYNMIAGGVGLRGMPKCVVSRRAKTLKKTLSSPAHKEKIRSMLMTRYAEKDSASKISSSLLEFYSNHENKAKAAANLERIRANPEIEARRIASIRIAAADLDLQKRRTDASTATIRKPENRARKSESTSLMWENPGHAKKVRESIERRLSLGLSKNGYIYPKPSGKFLVKFRRHGIDHYLGTFDTMSNAVSARDAKLKELEACKDE